VSEYLFKKVPQLIILWRWGMPDDTCDTRDTRDVMRVMRVTSAVFGLPGMTLSQVVVSLIYLIIYIYIPMDPAVPS